MSSDKDAAGGFQFPACWSDDVRMGALFAQPRSENVNPQDWIGKYKFWRETIAAWAAHHDQLLVDVDQLKQAFWRKGKTPACLQRVLEEMAKRGELLEASQCQGLEDPSSWTAWGLGLVKTSVAWSWNKVKSSLFEIERQLPSYVVVSVLKDQCQRVMELAAAASGETVEVADLAELEPRLFATERQTRVLLGQLKKERRVAVDDTVAPAVVKFIAGDDRKAPASPSRWNVSLSAAKSPGQASREKAAGEITEVDRTLIKLRQTEKILTDELDKIHAEMSRLEQTVRQKLKEGPAARAQARSALYRRKQLQAVLDKRDQALMNIQTLKMQLSQSQTDTKIMEAYQMGLSALKKSFADQPLTEDKLQDTLFELETVLEQQRDLEQLMSSSIAGHEATDSDLEEELRDMLAADESQLHLPDVPAESPAKKSAATPAPKPIPSAETN